MVVEPDVQSIMSACERWFVEPFGQGSAAEALRAAAAALDGQQVDRYGEGGAVAEAERRMAQRLGTEAAVLMPSGTMAQQIALRLHCQARARDTVAFHPTCHLELHEHGGYAHLHGLRAELVGDRDRLIELSDLQSLRVPLGALLLELPQREIGGRLPEWEGLVEQVQWARETGAAVHLDGARLWESCPYYDRSPAEVAGLFDSVYVSLYKGLGGLGGSILAGSDALVSAARVWRRRHGGTLPGLFVLASGAFVAADELCDRMHRYLAHARAVGQALGRLPGVDVVPDPPQTPLFHLHLRADPDRLWDGHLQLARQRGVWLMRRPAASVLPGVSRIEYTMSETSLAFTPEEVADLFAELLTIAGSRPDGRGDCASRRSATAGGRPRHR
jgi:threonine aldolase